MIAQKVNCSVSDKLRLALLQMGCAGIAKSGVRNADISKYSPKHAICPLINLSALGPPRQKPRLFPKTSFASRIWRTVVQIQVAPVVCCHVASVKWYYGRQLILKRGGAFQYSLQVQTTPCLDEFDRAVKFLALPNTKHLLHSTDDS